MAKPINKTNSEAGSKPDLRIAQLLAEKSVQLEAVGIESAVPEVEWMLCHLLSVEKLELYLDGAAMLTDEILGKLDKIVERRKTRYPLQFILGESYFYGRKFFVNENVMAPTPETERLCEIAIDFCKFRKYENPRILDLGTGSGVISLTIASELKNAQVVALDISEKALDVAKQNAKTFGIENRVEFFQSDFFSSLKPENQFDLILSNPPYIAEPDYAGLDPEVLADPKIAMTAGDEGMDCIRAILKDAPGFLAQTGKIIFEIGYNQAEKVARVTDGDERYKTYAVVKDLNDMNRCIILGCDEPE